VCETCDLGLSTLVRLAGQALVGDRRGFRKLVSERIKRITVKPFMDINTMIEERLVQCCVHVGTQDGDAHQCVPFCAAQAWSPLSRMKPSELVARASREARSVGNYSVDATRRTTRRMSWRTRTRRTNPPSQ
jgi:uncharacterized radical SAM superfamily Fe-S cluster-containing enzyme